MLVTLMRYMFMCECECVVMGFMFMCVCSFDSCMYVVTRQNIHSNSKLLKIKEIPINSTDSHGTLQAPYKRSLAEVTDTLTQAIEELQHCKDLITRTKIDPVGYFDPVTKMVVHNRIQSNSRVEHIASDTEWTPRRILQKL